VPILVSTVSGVVIFPGTLGECFGGAVGEPLSICASLVNGVIAIAAAKVP